MKVKSAIRLLVLAGLLLPLTGFTENMPLLREETSASTQTDPADIVIAKEQLPQTDPADIVIAFDQFPPTAAGPMRPEMSEEEPLDGCD